MCTTVFISLGILVAFVKGIPIQKECYTSLYEWIAQRMAMALVMSTPSTVEFSKLRPWDRSRSHHDLQKASLRSTNRSRLSVGWFTYFVFGRENRIIKVEDISCLLVDCLILEAFYHFCFLTTPFSEIQVCMSLSFLN